MNIFKITTLVKKDSYFEITGEYLNKNEEPFSRYDILTYDKYCNKSILVSFALGENKLILDNNSKHPEILNCIEDSDLKEGILLFTK